MFFHLISIENKDETSSSKLKVVALLLMATPIHLSSLEILISIDKNWVTTLLKVFKCYVTKSPSFILWLYNFFHRNNFFTKDLDWYKIPNLFHKSLVIDSPDTFSNIESERHNQILLFAFRSNFFQSSIEVHVGAVLVSTMIHWSLSTNRSSILSFHSSKKFPLNFSISIFELLTISLHLKNQ